MPIPSLKAHTPTELFGKTDKWRQIFEQTSSTILKNKYIYETRKN